MDEELLIKAKTFAEKRGAAICERLGFGIHGIVVAIKSEREAGATALKIHSDREPYRRECEIYERLMERGISRILGHHVPQLIGCDDNFLALEMTVVTAPYVLDFAGAYLDDPPQFSDESWNDWRRKNEEQFGADWDKAQSILNELEDVGIHMLDPSPSNIRFR